MPARYYTLANLTSSAVLCEDPTAWPPVITDQLSFPSKEKFREWCVDPTTNHLFYSMVEGLNPHLRSNLVDNPPHAIYGFVADFDGDGIEIPKLIEKARTTGDRIRPTWVVETYSHKARVIWEFETPVQLSADNKSNEKLVKDIAKELGADKFAPGLDECSYNPTMFYELGRGWHPIGGLVRRDTILAVWLKLVDKMKHAAMDGGISVIPLDVVEAALAERYPNFRHRWSATFEVGQRGPLFWINDGIDRTGCVVTDAGMRAFSTRATKSLTTWQDLLGAEFVKIYHQKRLSEAAGDAYFDSSSGCYCLRKDSAWRLFGKEDMLMRLKVGGISHRLGKGSTCTEAEQVLVMIQENRRVEGSAPFLFNPNPVVRFNAMDFLNLSFANNVMKAGNDPDPDRFPWLADFFENVFDEQAFNGCRPLDYFFAWLQRFWRSGINGVPLLGQLMVLAGAVGRGKSFLAVAMLRKIMGGAVDASSYLLEGKGFNKELGPSPVWSVDDATSTASFNDHKRFSEMVKKHTASSELPYRAMYNDTVTIPWFGRIFITCNDDSDSLSILPRLDGSILDKIMLFKCHSTWSANFGSVSENNEMLTRELPHFLAWLDQWEPPSGVIDHNNPRYGVFSYHHPLLLEAARDSSPDHRFVEILESWRASLATIEVSAKTPHPIWEGTCTDLIQAINDDATLLPLMRSYTPVTVGKILNKIKYWKPLVHIGRNSGMSRYHIDLTMKFA